MITIKIGRDNALPAGWHTRRMIPPPGVRPSPAAATNGNGRVCGSASPAAHDLARLAAPEDGRTSETVGGPEYDGSGKMCDLVETPRS